MTKSKKKIITVDICSIRKITATAKLHKIKAEQETSDRPGFSSLDPEAL